jgi:hypothetical protein
VVVFRAPTFAMYIRLLNLENAPTVLSKAIEMLGPMPTVGDAVVKSGLVTSTAPASAMNVSPTEPPGLAIVRGTAESPPKPLVLMVEVNRIFQKLTNCGGWFPVSCRLSVTVRVHLLPTSCARVIPLKSASFPPFPAVYANSGR